MLIFLVLFFQYGLYASIVPGFIYAVLGTCKEATIGPTAPNALLSFNYAGHSVVHALTLGFFAGIVEIFAGIFNLGKRLFINYVTYFFHKKCSPKVPSKNVLSGMIGEGSGRGLNIDWCSRTTLAP